LGIEKAKAKLRTIDQVVLACSVALLGNSIGQAVFATEQDATDTVNKLCDYVQSGGGYFDSAYKQLQSKRGGKGSDQPLGFYVGTDRFAFNSGYEKTDPRTQAEFAYALHDFIANHGGGIDNFHRYQKDKATKGDPYDKAHVRFDQQAKFAASWWQQNSAAFEKCLSKNNWIYDAILDGNDVYLTWDWATHSWAGTQQYPEWMEYELTHIAKKK